MDSNGREKGGRWERSISLSTWSGPIKSEDVGAQKHRRGSSALRSVGMEALHSLRSIAVK